MGTPVTPKFATQLLRRYEIVPPAGDVFRPSHRGELGIEAALGGHKKGDGQRMITLTIGNISHSRPCPVAEEEASEVVERFSEQRSIPQCVALEDALTRLLVRASKMYEAGELESFVLHPLYLTDHGYLLGNVRMLGSRKAIA